MVDGKKFQFFNRQLQISDRDDMCAQDFNFDGNSIKMGDFQSQILYFWKKIFGQ